MGTQRALQEVDPLSLPVRLKVGPWRIQGWRGRGAYGTLYRVAHEGRETSGPFALKLAIYPGDERFEREAWLLSRTRSPYVPQFLAQGVWNHPAGAFPYLVMEWIDGEPLYDWSVRRNPSQRQVVSLLTQVAWAVTATHEIGGVHRDVKGDNVLVRPADGRAFLTDFGAGHYRGAATLTVKLLPPGTGAYRSPEAWDYLELFRRHPTAHYAASACDDLFALGVTAWRLVTDEYPPPTHSQEPGSEVWRQGGPGVPSLRALNPRVSPELESIIQRLLAITPIDRFEGRAREAAEALEQAAKGQGAELDVPLFGWGHDQRPRWRSPGEVRQAEDQDAAERKELELHKAQQRAQATGARKQAPPRSLVHVWGTEMVVALLGLLLAGLTVACLYQGPKVIQAASDEGAHKASSVAVGDSANAASTLAAVSKDTQVPAVGVRMPEKPFPGQRTPPCNKDGGETEIRGGCWYWLGDAKLPCTEDTYEWKGACYLPSGHPTRPSTSQSP